MGRAESPSSSFDGRDTLRRTLRRRRAELGEDDLAAASMAVLARLVRLAVVREARVLAGYHAVRGEVDIEGVLHLAADAGTVVTVPRVVDGGLEFVVASSADAERPGSFGIPEPVGGQVVDVAAHDAILVPLVAFDRRGNRLGQGAGYYDAALAPVRALEPGRRPWLIGVAHAFQEVAALTPESWDVPLDAVVTDEEVVEITPGAGSRQR